MKTFCRLALLAGFAGLTACNAPSVPAQSLSVASAPIDLGAVHAEVDSRLHSELARIAKELKARPAPAAARKGAKHAVASR